MPELSASAAAHDPPEDELGRALDRDDQRRIEQKILTDSQLDEAARRKTAPALAEPRTGQQAPRHHTAGQQPASEPAPPPEAESRVQAPLDSRMEPLTPPAGVVTVPRPMRWVALAILCVAAPILVWLFLRPSESSDAEFVFKKSWLFARPCTTGMNALAPPPTPSVSATPQPTGATPSPVKSARPTKTAVAASGSSTATVPVPTTTATVVPTASASSSKWTPQM